MHFKSLLILIIAITIAFSNSLFNHFLGDDEVVITRNAFYQTWDNLPRLFNKSYLTDSNKLIDNSQMYDSSGSVAYRPVLSLTFFVDYWLNGVNPFGYHLTNFILHLLNAGLVYLLVFFILRNSCVSLLSALLFGVHPIQVEAVCSIGYRGDLLATFFALGSFIFFLRAIHQYPNSRLSYTFSLVLYFLGLFSKESVIVLPVLMIIYAFYSSKKCEKSFIRKLGMFIVITLFYLFIYFKIFPNTTFRGLQLIGGDVSTHILTMFWVFAQYVASLCLPFMVKTLPPLYTPNMSFMFETKVAVSIILLGIILLSIVRSYKKYKWQPFFLFWFLIALLPVINIVPTPSPMAHRFLYFPSIGFLIVLAMIIDRSCSWLEEKTRFIDLKAIFASVIVGLCIFYTFHLNKAWKNNVTVGKYLIQHYPQNIKGYTILATEYFKFGKLVETKKVLEKLINVPISDPKIFYMLGVCNMNNLDQAKSFFEAAINIYPKYSAAYTAMGKTHLFHSKYFEAIHYLEKSLNITPSYVGYGYLIQSLLKSNQKDLAIQILEQTKKKITNGKQASSLQKFIDEAEQLSLPIDIGL